MPLLALVCTACSDRWPSGFHRACTDDGDCREPYQCLVWDDPLNGAINVCSETCATDEDCPSLAGRYCGETRLCDEGVCAFEYCD